MEQFPPGWHGHWQTSYTGEGIGSFSSSYLQFKMSNIPAIAPLGGVSIKEFRGPDTSPKPCNIAFPHDTCKLHHNAGVNCPFNWRKWLEMYVVAWRMACSAPLFVRDMAATEQILFGRTLQIRTLMNKIFMIAQLIIKVSVETLITHWPHSKISELLWLFIL